MSTLKLQGITQKNHYGTLKWNLFSKSVHTSDKWEFFPLVCVLLERLRMSGIKNYPSIDLMKNVFPLPCIRVTRGGHRWVWEIFWMRSKPCLLHSHELAFPAACGTDMCIWQQKWYLILNDEERILADPREFHIAGIHYSSAWPTRSLHLSASCPFGSCCLLFPFFVYF